jgi:hypothetical protein
MGELGAPVAEPIGFGPLPEWESFAPGVRSLGMDGIGIREMLLAARDEGLIEGLFRGLLHIAIGRKIARPNGTPVSSGITWRELAVYLKELHFDKDLAREVGLDPGTLAPRDRERFWYSTIAQARVDSPEASAEADELAADLKKLGFVIGPNPAGFSAPRKAEPRAKPKPKGKKK